MECMYIIIITLIFFCLLYNNSKFIEKFINSSEKLEIYLISLEKDVNRRNLLYKQINPKFYYAVNGNEVDNSGINLTRGEIGCYLSHVYMLKKVLTAKSDIVLILEDDAKLIINNDVDNTSTILDIAKNAPKDWEIIFLSYNYYETNIDNNNKNYKEISKIHGAQSYIVNKNNINIKKINTLFPIQEPFDIVLPKKFKSYIYFPKIFELSKYGSFSNTQNIK